MTTKKTTKKKRKAKAKAEARAEDDVPDLASRVTELEAKAIWQQQQISDLKHQLRSKRP